MLRNISTRKNTSLSDGDIVIRIGEVISIDDEFHGSRIKVMLEQDKNSNKSEIPYAFPLLPKTIQSIPKVGEAVLVITSRLNNAHSMRYYLGPLLSQPQYYYNEQYCSGRGSSTSLIDGSVTKPLQSIDQYGATTDGALPNVNDIALVGRKSEDIILKDGEIDLRCGIRQQKAISDENDKGLQGYVVFNSQNPAYLQLKYQRGLCKQHNQVADSVINLVADKINLISHKDTNYFNLTEQDALIKNEEMDKIMASLHQIPYGDKVKEALILMRDTIVNHVHPFPGLAPCSEPYVDTLKNKTFDDLLSTNVRIS
jgi:hypothetical protein